MANGELMTQQQAQQISPAQQAFQLAQREAKALAASSLVPKEYRGESGIANVMIAADIAKRIGASPLLVMQNLYIIQGKPSWSATFLIACVNASERFTPLRFEVEGDDPTKKPYRVRAHAKDKDSGEVCLGPWITWAMVEAEGWHSKPGSKWKTMPELMFLYRAAGFWSRLYAPEVAMGILTREEVEDIGRISGIEPPMGVTLESLKALEDQLVAEGKGEPIPEPKPEPVVTADEVRRKMKAAETLDELNDAADAIQLVPESDRVDLVACYNTLAETLS